MNVKFNSKKTFVIYLVVILFLRDNIGKSMYCYLKIKSQYLFKIRIQKIEV